MSFIIPLTIYKPTFHWSIYMSYVNYLSHIPSYEAMIDIRRKIFVCTWQTVCIPFSLLLFIFLSPYKTYVPYKIKPVYWFGHNLHTWWLAHLISILVNAVSTYKWISKLPFLTGTSFLRNINIIFYLYAMWKRHYNTTNCTI